MLVSSTSKAKISLELIEASLLMDSSQPTAEPKVEQTQSPASESAATKSLAQRRAFMRLSLQERCQILKQQAEEMYKHYQQNTEWQELETGDTIDY